MPSCLIIQQNTCLHRVIDDWYEAFNEKEKIGACFLDISKCFDCIDHELLLFKLRKYGVINNEITWFTSFLSDRKQSVFCHGNISDAKNIRVGIPQGIILGPSLFLIFINDISECIRSCTCNIYADDVVIYYPHEDIKVIIASNFRQIFAIQIWYHKNRLRINANKCNVMLLRSSKRGYNELNVYINNEQIRNLN